MQAPITFTLCLFVAAGGAFGSVLRFVFSNTLSRFIPHSVFPADTIIINMLGAMIMGVLIEFMALRWSVSNEIRALLLFGVLGGFTTFSRFAVDIIAMLERGEFAKVCMYVFLSVILTILAAYGAIRVTRMLLMPA